MNFELTEEQLLLKESAERFIASGYPIEPRASALYGVPLNHSIWSAFAEMGWLLAGVPEERAGFGGPIEMALIAEQFGRALVVEPYLGSAVLATALLVACPPSDVTEELIASAGRGDTVLCAAVNEPGARGRVEHCKSRAEAIDGTYAVSGQKSLALAATDADQLIVAARLNGADCSGDGIGIFAIDACAAGVGITPTALVDGSSAGTIYFSRAPARLLATESQGHACLAHMRDVGIATIAGEALGIITKLIELTAEYISTREQFGAPLSQFQVLRHRLADMVVAEEMMRSALFVAFAALQSGNLAVRGMRLAQVKGWTCETLRKVCGWALQSHGGMGMAEELPIGRFIQRMMVLDTVLGSAQDSWKRAKPVFG